MATAAFTKAVAVRQTTAKVVSRRCSCVQMHTGYFASKERESNGDGREQLKSAERNLERCQYFINKLNVYLLPCSEHRRCFAAGRRMGFRYRAGGLYTNKLLVFGAGSRLCNRQLSAAILASRLTTQVDFKRAIWILLVALLCASAILISHADALDIPGASIFNKGEKVETNGDIQEPVIELRNAVRLSSTNARAFELEKRCKDKQFHGLRGWPYQPIAT